MKNTYAFKLQPSCLWGKERKKKRKIYLWVISYSWSCKTGTGFTDTDRLCWFLDQKTKIYTYTKPLRQAITKWQNYNLPSIKHIDELRVCVRTFCFLPFQHDYHSNVHSFIHTCQCGSSFLFLSFFLFVSFRTAFLFEICQMISQYNVCERVCVCLAFSRKLKKGKF